MRYYIEFKLFFKRSYMKKICNIFRKYFSTSWATIEDTLRDTVQIKEVQKVLDILEEKTSKEVIEINLHRDENLEITQSKIWGIPYIPKKWEIPLSSTNEQLIFLAQINCEELPDNSLHPKIGILQFWIFWDNLFGLDFDDFTSNKKSQVIYYEKLGEHLSQEEFKDSYYHIKWNNHYSPVNDWASFKLTFNKTRTSMTPSSYQFDNIFIEIWNDLFSKKVIQKIYDLDNETLDYVYEKFWWVHHSIWWYPYFTQSDPRGQEKYTDYTEVLFQLDSECWKDNHWKIIWWDVWVCNFFITKSQLEKKDFSKVMYNWDCS
jgi:uncharacterized protein YwqG